MIGGHLRLTLIIAVILYFAIILRFLKNKALLLKYTLLWIFSGLAMAILVIFPGTLEWLIGILGIENNMNGLFLLCIGFIMIILMSITSIVSRLNWKIRTLAQENAILEKRVRELENTGERDR